MTDDVDAMEAKLESLKLERQMLEEQSVIEERKALIRSIKKKYGKNWRSVIGNAKDNQTLRQFAQIGRGEAMKTQQMANVALKMK
jgi:hypothetical protein